MILEIEYVDKNPLERVVKSFTLYLLAILLFLPSVTFSLINAEIFPWGIIFSFVYIRKIKLSFIIIISYLTISSVISLLQNGYGIAGELIRSLFAYLNVLFPLIVLLSVPVKKLDTLSRVSKVVFVALTVLGLLQYSGVLSSLDSLFKFFIPRGYATSLAFMGGRGVTLFSSEPARAGIEYIFLYLVLRMTLKSGFQKIICDILLGLFILFLIKSAMTFAFYLVFVVVYHKSKLPLLLPFLLVAPLFYAFIDLGSENRTAILIGEVLRSGDIQKGFYILSNNSGHRITSIIAGYHFGLTSIFGGGIGNWQQTSVLALQQSGINLEELRYFILYGNGYAIPIRGSGFLTNFIMDVGFVGMIILCSFLYVNISKYARSNTNVIILFLVKIFFFGSVGNPVSWVVLAIVLRGSMRDINYLTNNKSEDKKLFKKY